MKSISKLLSTLFYIGYLPRFHASIASIIGFSVYQFLFERTGNLTYLFLLYFIPLLIGLIAVYYFIQTSDSSHDPKEVVLDEFFAAALIPFFLSSYLLGGIVALFLFRVIDITKPGFLKKIDGMNSWIAIFLDDFAAVGIAIFIIKSVQLLFS